jgi:hypothetical protein
MSVSSMGKGNIKDLAKEMMFSNGTISASNSNLVSRDVNQEF